MAKKKGGKGGKGGKKKKEAGYEFPVQKFEPMPRSWPGKVSDEALFASLAQEARQAIETTHALDQQFVTLRVRQVDWDFHDLFITLPKTATVYRLQSEIAKVQHLASVYPCDVVVYKEPPTNMDNGGAAAVVGGGSGAGHGDGHAGAGGARGGKTHGADEGAPGDYHGAQGAGAAGGSAAPTTGPSGATLQATRAGGSALSLLAERDSHIKTEASVNAAGSTAATAAAAAAAAANAASEIVTAAEAAALSGDEGSASICNDPHATLASCFPEIAAFRYPRVQHLSQTLSALTVDDDDDAGGGQTDDQSTGHPSLAVTAAVPEKKPRGRSARSHGSRRSRSRSKSKSRPSSSRSTSSAGQPPDVPEGPICGELSVKFLHDLRPRRVARPQSAGGSHSTSQSRPGSSKKGGSALNMSSIFKQIGSQRAGGTAPAIKLSVTERGATSGQTSERGSAQPNRTRQPVAGRPTGLGTPSPPIVLQELPKAVTVYYDIVPYISKRTLPESGEPCLTAAATPSLLMLNESVPLNRTLGKLQSRQPPAPPPAPLSAATAAVALQGGPRRDGQDWTTVAAPTPRTGHDFDTDCAVLMREERVWRTRPHYASAPADANGLLQQQQQQQQFHQPAFQVTVRAILMAKSLAARHRAPRPSVGGAGKGRYSVVGGGGGGAGIGSYDKSRNASLHSISESLSAVMDNITTSLRNI
ncbi:hypothetical protein BC831DRAFT_441245 [Entophlyctis helioformis]|nr:hypothetical protein BC831DRAFT_441245 [Entophlyctis helioformis]